MNDALRLDLLNDKDIRAEDVRSAMRLANTDRFLIDGTPTRASLFGVPLLTPSMSIRHTEEIADVLNERVAPLLAESMGLAAEASIRFSPRVLPISGVQTANLNAKYQLLFALAKKYESLLALPEDSSDAMCGGFILPAVVLCPDAGKGDRSRINTPAIRHESSRIGSIMSGFAGLALNSIAQGTVITSLAIEPLSRATDTCLSRSVYAMGIHVARGMTTYFAGSPFSAEVAYDGDSLSLIASDGINEDFVYGTALPIDLFRQFQAGLGFAMNHQVTDRCNLPAVTEA